MAIREPDWEALNDVNFLIYTRVSNSMNEALSAIELSEAPDLDEKSPQWWRDRAKYKISTSLGTLMAWTWLIQHKSGIHLPSQAIRPFVLGDALNWLAQRLQIDEADKNLLANLVVLDANQETFQEAVLLLHSVAMSQGGRVKLLWEKSNGSVDFVVQFRRRRKREPYGSMEALLESFGHHWRTQLIGFELKMAISLLEMNKIELRFRDSHTGGRFEFSVPGRLRSSTSTVRKRPTGSLRADVAIPSFSLASRQSSGDTTQPGDWAKDDNDGEMEIISTSSLAQPLEENPAEDPPTQPTSPFHQEMIASVSSVASTPGSPYPDGVIQGEHDTLVLGGLPAPQVPLDVNIRGVLGEGKTTDIWKTDAEADTPPSNRVTATGEWRSLLDYDYVDWDTLAFLNQYSYQRMTNPLIKVMGHLETIRANTDQPDQITASLETAQSHLELMVNSMQAWTTLTAWKSTGIEPQFSPLEATHIPDWFVAWLRKHAQVNLAHQLTLQVNQAALQEALILLTGVAKYIGQLHEINSLDKKNNKGVWLRIIFMPHGGRRYRSKFDVLDSFVRTNPLGDELAMHYSIADDLLKLNNAQFTLQENQKSGEQAFAILLENVSAATPTPSKSSQVHTASARPEYTRVLADAEKSFEQPADVLTPDENNENTSKTETTSTNLPSP
jgi:hypothetical protein